MVGSLYELELGKSPFVSQGLTRTQGGGFTWQKPDFLVYYDGGNTDVPTLICPGHLKLNPPVGRLNPIEIPYSDIERVTTITGTATTAKKKVEARCQIENCATNTTFGVYIQRVANVQYPVVSEKSYFVFEADIDPDCYTDCTTRAQVLADKINADPNSIVLATVRTASAGTGSGSGSGTGSVLNYFLVLEDKDNNASFIANYEGFDTYTVVTQPGLSDYLVGNLREAYGPTFASVLASTVVLTATEIIYRRITEVGNSGGSSSYASIDANYEVQRKLGVVITNAAITNSASAKTELDAITNGTKTVTLYLDKQC